ncbi:CHAP domain-containing protein, partial [Solemya velum gill symbiont]
LTKEQSDKLFAIGKQSCDSQCATSFGKVLGKADNAIGYSNCSSACIRPRFSFLNLKTGEVTIHDDDPKNADLHYIGLIYQCVEYSRRWWMKNKGITYGSVDSAYEILYLTEGKDIHTGKNFPLARSINGTTQRPPKRGDLLIYHPTKDDPKWRYGHVAVVVDVDLKAGTISVAEENYSNLPWEDPGKYSRKIRLFNISGRYTVLDVPTGESNNPGGARVSGWVYEKIGTVSATALGIRNTPHYDFAKKTLDILKASNSIEGIEFTKEYLNYERYVEHEAVSCGKKIHNVSRYLKLINQFLNTKCDLINFPIVVNEFATLQSGEFIFYIIDGIHRAAYIAAYSDVMGQSAVVHISPRPGISHWPNIRKIDFGDTVIEVKAKP